MGCWSILLCGVHHTRNRLFQNTNWCRLESVPANEWDTCKLFKIDIQYTVSAYINNKFLLHLYYYIFKMKGFCTGSHITFDDDSEEKMSKEDSWIRGTHTTIEEAKIKLSNKVSCSLYQQMVGVSLVSSNYCVLFPASLFSLSSS